MMPLSWYQLREGEWEWEWDGDLRRNTIDPDLSIAHLLRRCLRQPYNAVFRYCIRCILDTNVSSYSQQTSLHDEQTKNDTGKHYSL